MLNLLTPYGIPEISIITGLAVAAIILITLNIVFIVRATRKPTEQDEHVTYVPVPAPVEEPQPEPLPQPVVLIADTTPEQEEALARLRLDRSFTAKLVQTEDETKELYAELKRELLSYNGVHARMSWRRETYSKSREALARFGVRGKTLCLYLALQPEEFADTKYKAEDVSSNNSFADTPLMYRIKNPLRMRYAKELIATLMAQRGLEKGEYVGDDPLADLGYRSTPALIDEGLIRVPAGMELPVFNEPVQEVQPEPVAEVVEAVEEPQPAEEIAVVAAITPEQEALMAQLRLDRSFTAKLVQTEDETKELYAELKRELLSYNGVHARMSWRRETYSKSREALARFGVRGKTLCLYLALQPEEFADTKYKAEDVSSNNSFADTPLMYRIKNPLRMRYAKELIATLMAQRGLEKGEYVGDDPLADLGYRSTPALIDEGLIRVPAGMELPVFNEPVQEVQPEPVVEAVEVVEEPQPAEEIAVVAAITPEQEALMAQLRLDRSFTAKLVQTEDETKELYAELKRELLSYNGVHARMSWRRETYSKSREALARFGVRGKTLCLYLALQPEEFADTKYKAEDVSSNNSFADTPLMYRIKNPLRMRYAKELIATLMAQRGLEKGEYVGDDPLADLGYRSTPALIEEGLIRVPAGMELPVFNEPVQEVQPEPVVEVAEVVEEPQPAEEIAVAAAITPEQEALMAQLRLDRSFTAKLVQTEDETKELYAELKRELLSYNGVHVRMSWRRETYSKSREALARFGVRGKTLCLYLALQPEEFADTKYKAEDVSSNNSFADTPLMYRIKNPLRMRYAKELIATLMAQRGLEKGEYVGDDPLADLNYRSTPALIEEGLIRVPAGMELPVFNEPVQEPVQEVQPEPVAEVVEEPQPEPVEEIAIAEAVEAEPEPEPVEAVAEEPQPEPVEVVEEPVPELVEEVAEEPVEAVAEEPQPEPEPVPEPEPEPVPEHCIPVVGVAFPRRPNKLYWFDPDGKTWSKGEVALYVSPDGVKMEVVVAVELTERAESLLHLPLKPLKKLHS